MQGGRDVCDSWKLEFCLYLLVPVSTPFVWVFFFIFFFKHVMRLQVCFLFPRVAPDLPLSLRRPILSCTTALKDMHHEFLTHRTSLLGVK